VALFKDTDANALAVRVLAVGSANWKITQTINHFMLAGTASQITFKIRAGGDVASTTTFNGSSGARLYGGSASAVMQVDEIMV
jgi:hypothetical protein